jgi:hypothetical protein
MSDITSNLGLKLYYNLVKHNHFDKTQNSGISIFNRLTAVLNFIYSGIYA